MRIRFQYLVSAAIVAVIIALIAYLIFKPESHSGPPKDTAAPNPVPVQSVATSEPEAESEPYVSSAMDDTSTEQDSAATEPAPAAADSHLVAAPEELAGSDAVVLQVLTQVSPQLTKWLIPDEQIRKWVLTVDLMADGKLPKRYRPLDYPMDKFAVTKQDGLTVAAEENFARLTPLINTVTAIDAKLLAEYYRAWSPLLDKAYREQGKPGSFEERLLLALSRIISTEPLAQAEALERPTVFYHYKDETLEQATDVEKLCWRMGIDNLLAVQQFARDLRQQLDPI